MSAPSAPSARSARIDTRTVQALFAGVDHLTLAALRRADPHGRFEVLIGPDVTSLWYADHKVSVITTPSERSPHA